MTKQLHFKSVYLAQTFVDYMATKAVSLRLDDTALPVIVYLDDETAWSLVQQELQQFLQQPTASRYRHASWQQGRILPSGTTSSALSSLRAFMTTLPPFTLLISLLSLLTFICQWLLGNTTMLSWFSYPAGNEISQLWRYITPIFLHFSVIHIVFNLCWWLYLGQQIE